ncbi:hypothetical protein QO002_006311 [Pararhizobium capsulatum DSM 1112]|uniref:Transposase n=1 Tax=Pararhizobium capsulatum DSM 1112 TaxID=1121113 RepID=A0ABU0C0R0_9HYPH|nr:hypothetical protein [Pararhizobium capsulatum DSM 1112]
MSMLTENDRPLQGRRVSWSEFYWLRPDLRPANDNVKSPIPLNIEAASVSGKRATA